MVLQGFDPMENTTSDFVAFCERHEFTEGSLDNSKDPKKEAKPKAHSKNSSNDAKSRAKPSAEANKFKKRSASTDKWCDLHQTSGHSTAECKVVQSQITKMRSSWEPVRPKFNNNTNPNSKTPGKVNFKDNNFKNKELMSLVQEQVKKILKVKRQKTSHEVHNTESAAIEDTDFDIDEFENIEINDSEDDL
jgi:hypothetical protein